MIKLNDPGVLQGYYKDNNIKGNKVSDNNKTEKKDNEKKEESFYSILLTKSERPKDIKDNVKNKAEYNAIDKDVKRAKKNPQGKLNRKVLVTNTDYSVKRGELKKGVRDTKRLEIAKLFGKIFKDKNKNTNNNRDLQDKNKSFKLRNNTKKVLLSKRTFALKKIIKRKKVSHFKNVTVKTDKKSDKLKIQSGVKELKDKIKVSKLYVKSIKKKIVVHNQKVEQENNVSFNGHKNEPVVLNKQEKGNVLNLDAVFITKKYDHNVPELVKTDGYIIQRNADEIFSEVVKHFSFVVNKGGGEAKILLTPPELGTIKMSVKLSDGKVSTAFFVDNPTVKEIIDSKLLVLQQNLLEQGFQLGSFEVSVKDQSTNLNNFAEAKNNRGSIKKVVLGEDIEDLSGELIQSIESVPWMSNFINIQV